VTSGPQAAFKSQILADRPSHHSSGLLKLGNRLNKVEPQCCIDINSASS